MSTTEPTPPWRVSLVGVRVVLSLSVEGSPVPLGLQANRIARELVRVGFVEAVLERAIEPHERADFERRLDEWAYRILLARSKQRKRRRKRP